MASPITSILLIEDNELTAQLYQRLLEDTGYNVLTAPDTQAADQLLQGIEVDLIILDFVLPDRTGIEWLGELRKHPQHERLPVIMVSGTEREVDLRSDRYVWFMAKPRQPQHIVTAVQSTIAAFSD